MSAKYVKVQEEVTAKTHPHIWGKIKKSLAKGGELLTARKLQFSLYEITYNDPRLGLCRTKISPRE